MQNELTIGEQIYFLDKPFPRYIVEVIAIHHNLRPRFIWVPLWWGGFYKRDFYMVQSVTLKNNDSLQTQTLPMDIARKWKRVDTE
jgi:hypothetical protein